MNKAQINSFIRKAIEALKSDECLIQERDKNGEFTGKIIKTYRSSISSFGAAITMGSFKSAIAFFSDDGGSSIKRSELIRAMYFIVHDKWKDAKSIYSDIVKLEDAQMNAEKENFINASVAIKLAMNAFELIKEKEKENKND